MRMRIILALLLAGLVAGCSSKRSDREQVVAGFYPLAYAAEQVGGSRVDVKNLTPAGAEPHDLELTPSAVRKIHDADLVLLLGHGFQPQVEAAARDATGRVLTLLDTPGLRRRDDDPHVWLDPTRYALLVRVVGRALHGRPGAGRLEQRLRALDRMYTSDLSDCSRREIVTSHAAFGYLAERYGLEQISIEGLSPEAEPSPRELARVAAIVRARHVTTVYFETLVSPKLAATLARETGTKTAVLDPLEGLTPKAIEAGANYFSVMRANLRNLRRGLGC